MGGAIMRATKRPFRFWAGVLAPLLGAAVIVLAIVATRSPTIQTASGAEVISMEQTIAQKPSVARPLGTLATRRNRVRMDAWRLATPLEDGLATCPISSCRFLK